MQRKIYKEMQDSDTSNEYQIDNQNFSVSSSSSSEEASPGEIIFTSDDKEV